jgi:hypothetical protein
LPSASDCSLAVVRGLCCKNVMAAGFNEFGFDVLPMSGTMGSIYYPVGRTLSYRVSNSHIPIADSAN